MSTQMSTQASQIEAQGTAQISRRRHSIGFWIVRIVLGIAVTIAALLLSGVFYEKLMAPGDAQRYPAPGVIYEVDGHAMHLNCTGEAVVGAPTVIFETGANDWGTTWALVQPQVSNLTRSCSYDRAGLGWSEANSAPRSPSEIATELHSLLTTADVQPPYVLVGHSMGGKYIRLYTVRYPEEVAGLVFVDARHESIEPVKTPEESKRDGEIWEQSLNMYRVLRDTGLARLGGVSLAAMFNPDVKFMPEDIMYVTVLQAVRESTLQGMIMESRGNMLDDDDLRAHPALGGLPIIVLTAEDSLQYDGWEAGQAALARLSTNSRQVIVEHSHHNIHHEQPQAVTDAIAEVLEAVESQNPV